MRDNPQKITLFPFSYKKKKLLRSSAAPAKNKKQTFELLCYMSVCVCVCVCTERERERERDP